MPTHATPANPHRASSRRLRRSPSLLACGASAIVALIHTPGCGQRDQTTRVQAVEAVDPVDRSVAELLYVRHCAACHGPEGHGDGPAGQHLYPKPRAFHDSPMRFAATGAGESRVLDAIARTIREGMPRSSMPGYGGVLSEAEIRGIAGYVHEMGSGVRPAVPPRVGPLIASKPPEVTPGLIAYGANLFQSMGCVTCHGESGRGDGLAMQGLMDSLGLPIHPADLASGLYKAGSEPDDLFRVIVSGVPGTPMIGYSDMLYGRQTGSAEGNRKAWALVAYVQSLAPPPDPPAVNSGAEIALGTAPDPAMFDDPSHTAWRTVRETSVSLRPLWQRPDSTRSLSVAALRAGDRIAFRLVWDDDTCDVGHDSGDFPDGVAVMFAMGDEAPALPMGVEVEGYTPATPVNVWHWKASRQYDAATGRRHDSSEPRTLSGDGYYLFPPTPNGHDQPREAHTADHDKRVLEAFNLAATNVGNPHASPAVLERPVLEANALGFGTLTYQQPESQHTGASALWTADRWYVTTYRPLKTNDDDDVDLTTPRRVPVAFAVWDGARGDRAGVKLVSGWHWLVINPGERADAGGR